MCVVGLWLLCCCLSIVARLVSNCPLLFVDWWLTVVHFGLLCGGDCCGGCCLLCVVICLLFCCLWCCCFLFVVGSWLVCFVSCLLFLMFRELVDSVVCCLLLVVR